MTHESDQRAAWRRYHANHPEVLVSWGEQNGRWPNCTCARCDPGELLPRPNIVVVGGDK